ncbi:hypothetical protein [Lactobacillus jensenii]|uniref:Uncharacterized protein n=1 Tax=Lactobacillus jensenii TaxID=109790 RepID=A0ABU9FL47_LACJE|nr:hypothetical protein [Lactobacillus jensenii]DAR66711.1 MAG TPA: hypothetical protein [Caudoviricetes sp.]MCW8072183.1 hypothetical protein [Lactobacillus jensenii]MCW8089589.1 hypothetical protein [Lactobacillus jensenii]MDK8236071.1 hypothetical protein [Lactobacillus jensenii]MDT9544359.1 hypothetical protein [Lactobacillus jensenii]
MNINNVPSQTYIYNSDFADDAKKIMVYDKNHKLVYTVEKESYWDSPVVNGSIIFISALVGILMLVLLVKMVFDW